MFKTIPLDYFDPLSSKVADDFRVQLKKASILSSYKFFFNYSIIFQLFVSDLKNVQQYKIISLDIGTKLFSRKLKIFRFELILFICSDSNKQSRFARNINDLS